MPNECKNYNSIIRNVCSSIFQLKIIRLLILTMGTAEPRGEGTKNYFREFTMSIHSCVCPLAARLFKQIRKKRRKSLLFAATMYNFIASHRIRCFSFDFVLSRLLLVTESVNRATRMWRNRAIRTNERAWRSIVLPSINS